MTSVAWSCCSVPTCDPAIPSCSLGGVSPCLSASRQNKMPRKGIFPWQLGEGWFDESPSVRPVRRRRRGNAQATESPSGAARGEPAEAANNPPPPPPPLLDPRCISNWHTYKNSNNFDTTCTFGCVFGQAIAGDDEGLSRTWNVNNGLGMGLVAGACLAPCLYDGRSIKRPVPCLSAGHRGPVPPTRLRQSNFRDPTSGIEQWNMI